MAKIQSFKDLKPTTKVEATEEASVDTNALLQEIQAMRAEMAQLKTGENKFQKAKEKYTGPRNFSYKLWGGIPVLSYVSKKKDVSKDLVYKNAQGQFISNHFLALTLADGNIVDVEVNEFNSAFTRSEKMFAIPVSDGVSIIGYTFDNSDYGKFTVSSSIIN